METDVIKLLMQEKTHYLILRKTHCLIPHLAFECFSCLQLVSQLILLAHESRTHFVL